MNYSQTLEFITSAMPSFQQKGADAYKPGLDRIVEFCRTIGNPQRNFFTIHIAGTDGKGSVASMIAAVLQSAGYTTGLFTSPHLHEFRERIKVDGEVIPKQKVVNFIDKNREAITAAGLSFFEMTAAMAFDYFDQSNVEVAVIETGLGGRLDATNIITPILSVITNVGVEHSDILGSTLAEIAAEKAGIIKKSIPVIIGERNDDCAEVFENRASELKSKIIYAAEAFELKEHLPSSEYNRFKMLRARDGYLFDIRTDLFGEYQKRNIVTVCSVLDFLHEETPLTISRRALYEGMATAAATTGLMGRWDKIGEAPLTICDTGHTPYAFAYLARQISEVECQGRKVAVLGFSNDKDIEGILKQLADARLDEIIFTQPDVARAMRLDRIVEAAGKCGIPFTCVDTVASALALAREKAGEDGFVFAGGSTFVVGEIR